MGKVIMSGIVEPLTVPVGLPPIGTALNACTWEQIRKVSDAGQAANYFSVGDTKNITINGTVGATTFSNLTVAVFILGINHNASAEGANRIHFGLGKISGKDVCLVDSNYGTTTSTGGYFNMNLSNVSTASGGWEGSRMRRVLLGNNYTPTSPGSGTLLAALPSDLLAVMKSVTKYSDNTGGGSVTAADITATTDYLWLLSEFEVHGARTYANSAEKDYQLQYDYYKAGNSKIKYRHNATNTAASWWVRSTNVNNGRNFCRVETNGTASGHTGNYCYGVAPAFAV